MENLIPISIIAVIILSLILYLQVINFNDKFTEDNLYYSKLAREINKNNYLKYKKERNNVIKDSNFKFGFSALNNTNEKTIGICPLGYYYDGNYEDDPLLNSKKCKKCLNCNLKDGYYLESGCLGNKNSICKFGKVPYDIFMRAHNSKSLLHSQLPINHKHKIRKNKKFIDSSKKHTHI